MAGKRLFAGSQKAVSAKESAEWLYNERSKFEATQEPVYQVGDTVFWREKHTISLPLELLMYSCCLQEWCTQFIGRKAKRILNAF